MASFLDSLSWSALKNPIPYLFEYLNIDTTKPIDRFQSQEYFQTSLLILALCLVFWIVLHSVVYEFLSNPLAIRVHPDKSTSTGTGANASASPSKAKPKNTSIAAASTSHSQSVIYARQKFNVAFWKAVNYGFLFYFGYKVIFSDNWVYDYMNYYAPVYQVPWPLAIYYQLTISSYLYGTYTHLFVDHRLKDFGQMLAHHLVTLFLTIGSYYVLSALHIGAIVMILHDISDPFMEFAKLCLYAKHEIIANISFVTFAMCFLISRCVIYPIFVIIPVFSVAIYRRSQFVAEMRTGEYYVAALCIIELLDFYWGYLIVKMIWHNIVHGKVQQDVRED